MNTEKPIMGRPKFPPGKAATVDLVVRVTVEFREQIKAAAKRRGQTYADFIREVMAAASK